MAIQIEILQDSLIIRPKSPQFNEGDAKECVQACQGRDKSLSLIVFDFSWVHHMEPETLDIIVDVAKNLHTQKQKFLMLANQEFANQVDSMNLDEVFQCFVRSAAMKEASSESQTLEAGEEVMQINTVLTEAVGRVIQSYAAASSTVSSIALTPSEALPPVEIAGIITVFGDRFRGSLFLGFPLATFLGLVSKINKKSITELRASDRDWATELLNVSFGQLRTALNGRGYKFSPAIPSLVHGKTINWVNIQNGAISLATLKSEFGEYYVATLTTKK